MPSTTLFDLPRDFNPPLQQIKCKTKLDQSRLNDSRSPALVVGYLIYLSLRLTSSILALVLYRLVGVSDMSNYYNTQSNSALSKFCFTDASLICALE